MLQTAPFVQDDWKINKKLTVNAGLRWDYFGHLGLSITHKLRTEDEA
jgi:outer membrane receptor protein involved in Fe transport